MLEGGIKDQIIILITSGALSFLSASLFSRLFVPIAFAIGAVDRGIGERRMHREPMARVGGVCIYAACILGATVAGGGELFSPLLLGGGAIVLGGLWDDIRGVTPVQKLIIQGAAGSLALLVGTPVFRFDMLTELFPRMGGILEYGASVLWLILLCNAFNIIDGLDGLCSMSAVGSICALMVLTGFQSTAGLIFLSSVLGFLPRNLRPARLFLGDSGSMLLGFAMGVLTLDGTSRGVEPLYLMLIVAYPILETLISALRRWLSGNHPFAPDRGHLHHRLCDGGLSHGGAAALLSLLHSGLCALAVTISADGWSGLAVVSLLLLTFALIFVIIMAKNVKSPKGA